MAACVLARKAEWIRNAGLAAVLLFPAVAALHGIVLACLHREGKSEHTRSFQDLLLASILIIWLIKGPLTWMFTEHFNSARLEY